MKIIDCVQGELSWFQARLGKVTASEADALLTPEFKVRTGAMPHTYLCQKLGEAMTGTPPDGFATYATDQGQLLELDARRWYRFAFDEPLKDAGFIEHDDGRSGCSPDAIIGDNSGLEIKAPRNTNHVRYLLDGVLPNDYKVQVHFSMYVTGFKSWRFVSYNSKLPKFVLTVERDEEICAQIQAALTKFYAAYDEGMSRLRNSAPLG